jgi:hypothetical protein
MNDKGMLPPMQHGSVPGKHCLSAVLKKVLCHDYLQLTKRAGAFLENDEIGCYDRLVNNQVLMVMTKRGLPKSVTSCIGDLRDNVVHVVKTIYGLSSASYGSMTDKPLYGPGQGSTCGPLFWLLCYWVIVTSLDPSITAGRFIYVCKDVIVELTGVSFVDDSSLCVMTEYIANPELIRLASLGQYWERLLFSTGGAIHFKKSHWYLMSWLWQAGIPRLATMRQSPASLSLSTGANILPDVVPRIEPTKDSALWGCTLPLRVIMQNKLKSYEGMPSVDKYYLRAANTPLRICCLLKLTR